MTEQTSADEHNKRVLQAVAYLTEWAKHVVTASAALMVLGATLLKDLAKELNPPASYVVATALILFYISMLVSVMLALKLVRQCANVILTTQPQLGTGTELATLKTHLGRTQVAFFVGLASFSVVAVTVLLSWAFPSAGPKATVRAEPTSAQTLTGGTAGARP